MWYRWHLDNRSRLAVEGRETMNEKLIMKIRSIINNNCSEWGDDLDVGKTCVEVAALLEAERKPVIEGNSEVVHLRFDKPTHDTEKEWIPIKFGVRSVEAPCELRFGADGVATHERKVDTTPRPDTITIPEAVAALVKYFDTNWAVDFSDFGNLCGISMRKSFAGYKPDWIMAIVNGNNSPAAVKVGLEDLFVSILMDAKEAGK